VLLPSACQTRLLRLREALYCLRDWKLHVSCEHPAKRHQHPLYEYAPCCETGFAGLELLQATPCIGPGRMQPPLDSVHAPAKEVCCRSLRAGGLQICGVHVNDIMLLRLRGTGGAGAGVLGELRRGRVQRCHLLQAVERRLREYFSRRVALQDRCRRWSTRLNLQNTLFNKLAVIQRHAVRQAGVPAAAPSAPSRGATR